MEKLAESGEYNLTGDRYREVIDYSKVKWPMVRLGEVCEILDHLRKPVKKADRNKGEYPYYGATGIVDYVDKYIFNEKLVLVGEDGAKWESGEKTAFIVTGKYWVNNHAHVLRPDRTKILDELLVEFLNNMDLSLYITGITVPKLTQQKLKQIQIPLPPIEVQKQIVAELDSYQKVIDGARQIIENWKPRIKIDPEWPMVKLGEVAENLDRKRIPITKSNRKLGPYPYYGASGIVDYVDDYIFDGEFLLISEDGANLLARTFPIAFSVSGKIWVNNHVHVLKFKHIETQKFVEIYINDIDIKNYVTGMAQPKLKQKALNSIPIPLPSLETQKQIVAEIENEQKIIDQLKVLIKIYNQKIKDKISEIWGQHGDS